MKKSSWIISILCTIWVLFLIPIPTYANEIVGDTYEGTITLTKKSDGIYEATPYIQRSGNSAVQVRLKSGGQIGVGEQNALYMRIDENRFMKADSLSIDVNNYMSFPSIARTKGLSSQLISDVSKIMTKVHNGEIEMQEPLVVYFPEPIIQEDEMRSITTSTKTYTGYAGRQYYQELLDCKGNSLEFNVRMPSSRWSQYCTQLFVAAASVSASAGIDAVTGGSWSLLSVFLHSTSDSIPSTQAFRHTAKLFENKYTKYTYLIQDGVHHTGSVIDYTYNYFFRNFINVDGVDFYSNGDTGKQTVKAKGYDKADEYAYRHYADLSYNASVLSYDYRNTTLGISTYVDSLF